MVGTETFVRTDVTEHRFRINSFELLFIAAFDKIHFYWSSIYQFRLNCRDWIVDVIVDDVNPNIKNVFVFKLFHVCI